MSYMRYNHPLRWFEGMTDAYIWPDINGMIWDYGDLCQMSKASFCELVGRFVDRSQRDCPEHRDLDFPVRVAADLARRIGCADMILSEIAARIGSSGDLDQMPDEVFCALVAHHVEGCLRAETRDPFTYTTVGGGTVTVQAEPDLGFARRFADDVALRIAREKARHG